MTEETKKPAAKKAAAPKAAAKPKAEKAPAAAKAAPKAAKPVAAAKSGKTLTILQTGSPIGRERSQQATLIGLGLNKRHRTRTLEDSPSVRGMIEKVKHLVKIVG